MGFDPENYQQTMRKYHQLIHGVDFAIGMVQDELQRQGKADNTVIILTSDNGFFCGSHGFGGKVLPYEEGSKVPLIVYDPRRKTSAGMRATTVTGTVDIAPTILELAGELIPAEMDGKSLVAVLDDSQAKVRQSLPLFQVWGAPTTFSMSVVTESHKYIYWCYGDKMDPAEELFNLVSDPLETKNVVGDPSLPRCLKRCADAIPMHSRNGSPMPLRTTTTRHSARSWTRLFPGHKSRTWSPSTCGRNTRAWRSNSA